VQEQANFWGCEGFCPNFPKLAGKKSKENNRKEMTAFHSI